MPSSAHDKLTPATPLHIGMGTSRRYSKKQLLWTSLAYLFCCARQSARWHMVECLGSSGRLREAKSATLDPRFHINPRQVHPAALGPPLPDTAPRGRETPARRERRPCILIQTPDPPPTTRFCLTSFCLTRGAHVPNGILLRVDSPFFLTIVLFEERRFSRKKDP